MEVFTVGKIVRPQGKQPQNKDTKDSGEIYRPLSVTRQSKRRAIAFIASAKSFSRGNS